ncbi:hypothetical protein B0J13DRAFT_623515 [Dactylonectria estremocensis]|uniref:Uncharacterized protein n=1 Tax=Dactylonectria estremocensis TaxID=1079267 RepID=A0A9P9ES16_9HYPO|nr:hypothetical protein B0J13DRAFT_623515 [Dactylonectria estremocensis]
MPTTTEQLKLQFPDLEWKKLPAPKDHKGFIYYGLGPEKTTIKQGHMRAPGRRAFLSDAAGMSLRVDRGLSWHGQPFMRLRDLVPWYVGSKAAGRWKSYEPLAYAEIAEAGHLAPFDKLEEALTLINSWIQGQLPAL